MAGSCAPSLAPGWTPDWIFCPQDKILSVVVEWIVGGFIMLGNALAGAITAVFDAFGAAGASAGDAVVFSYENVAEAFLGVVYGLNNTILDMAASAGPAGPFIIVALFVGLGLVLLGALVGLRKVMLWLT